MRLLILASAAILPAGSAAAPAPTAAPPEAAATQHNDALAQPARVISPVPSTCKPIGSVAQGDRRLGPNNLNELPPAQTYMAVYRRDENGCIDPMLASERQGYRAPR
jgi:hypothetical protein